MVDPLTAAAAASAAATAYSAWQGSRDSKKNRKAGGMSKSQKYYAKKSAQDARKAFRQATRDRRKYGEKSKQYDKDIKQFLKKYGGEKYIKNPALNKEQQGLLKKMISEGKSGMKHKDIPLPKKSDLKKLPKMAKQQPIEKLGKFSQNPNFQQGQEYLRDMLSGSKESYDKFANPIKSEFERETLPQLANRFAGNTRSSAFQNALGDAGVQLNERLGRLRGELQQSAVQPNLNYLNAGQANEQQGINNTFAENQAANEYNRERYGRASAENADIYNRNNLKYGRAQDARNYGFEQASRGLGTSPWNATFRSATPPQQPGQPAPFNAANYQQYQPAPNAWQRFSQNAASGAGNAAGQFASSFVSGGGLNNLFNRSPSPGPQVQGTAPNNASFGYSNQLGGKPFTT